MEHLINYRGLLAVASPWRSDYDRPLMVRTVWVSKHSWHESWEGLHIVGASEVGQEQSWAASPPSRSLLTFRTPLHGVLEEGAPIKKPRKPKVGRDYTYKAGSWGRFAT